MANEYKFKGKNKLGTRRLFENRKSYRDEALYIAEDDVFFSGVQDFFVGTGLSFYGRVDESRNFVSLLDSRAKYFKRSATDQKTTNHRAADFVVDAYENFIKEFEDLVRESRCGISADDIDLKVVSAWKPYKSVAAISANTMAKTIEKKLFDYGTDLGAKSRSRKVNELTTIEQFLSKVSLQLRDKKITNSIPLSGTSVMSSKYCSVSTTGLSIILRDSKFDDDEAKSIFMNEIIFDFYRQAAMKHGFIINKNAPWQLVANIDSSAMASYMEERLTSKEELWNTHYTKVHYSDIENIKKFILAMWNGFVDTNPIARRRVSRCAGKGTTVMKTKRARYTIEQLNEKIKPSQWIKLYCEIRAS